MRFVEEYRDPNLVASLCAAIEKTSKHQISIMEVCGGQTHSIVKYGLDQLLPKNITLIHGPGCPVCVTASSHIDNAIKIAQKPNTIVCSFGDMLRVPGEHSSLLDSKACGANVRVVYSPLDALEIAKNNPRQCVVFFAVGFETTAPATALAVLQAEQQGIKNFTLLVSHVLVPPAIESLLQSPECKIDAFLAAGHVCTVMGYEAYEPLVKKYRVPIVVTGFEPADILQGVHMCVTQLEQGKCKLENQYLRAVSRKGNRKAQELIAEVFKTTTQSWRGIGAIKDSGLSLKKKFHHRDAKQIFQTSLRGEHINSVATGESVCISGEVLQGLKKPPQCRAFGRDCTPEHPRGAPMVSSEGACAAYYRYARPPSACNI